MSLTEAQLEQRLDYITGSDAAVICGVSPWGNIIDLWRQKLRLAENEDISWKPAVKAGNYLEPVVAQWFSDETGKLCEVDTEFKIHKTIPFMAGNIDRRITGEKAILECKTTSRDDNWGADGDNVIPDYYLLQCAHYCAVCDVDRVYIAVLIRGVDFRWYTYDRNAKLEEMLIKKETEFWDCVQNQRPPEPRTVDEVVSLYAQATDEEPLIVDAQIDYALDQLKQIRESIKQLQGKEDAFEACVKAFMRNHHTLHDRNGKIIATWRNTSEVSRFDSKRFEKENESLYLKYIKKSPGSRRFILK